MDTIGPSDRANRIRIVLAGLRGEKSIAALCRREGIVESLCYSWSKKLLEAGEQRQAGDTARQAETCPRFHTLILSCCQGNRVKRSCGDEAG